ncbi:MAG TPA: hypothetical protein VGR43_03185 [Dehalococcoidia bacterium]|jgi:hypothetical protein|nr:hypothetical protein [Dehalococcoidia bacterium]
MLTHPYTLEKLTELEAERRARARYQMLPRRRPQGNGLLRSTGRALQRAGEALESWAAPSGGPAARHDISCPDGKRY